MDSRFSYREMEDSDNSGGDSPRSTVSADTKIASTSSSKRSRRAIQKKVVSVAIKDVERLRSKSDLMTTPPSDSWAWRKYGQKPIKGSPYPRGYYRCSSSKGCPARKQVERSRVDPNTLVVTYYCEHNHNWPASKNNHHKTAATAASPPEEEEELEEEEEEKKPIIESNQTQNINKYSNISEGQLIHNTEFGWFNDFECTMLESTPMLTEDRISTDNEMAMIFTMREEDDSFFADLGELPECSKVFRRGMEEQRRRSLATTT